MFGKYRLEEPFRKALMLSGLLVSVFVMGIVGYHLIEGWTLFDAFYMTVITVGSGSGLVTWTIVAPGGNTSFDVPDLTLLPGPDPLGLRHGPIVTDVYTARIDQFSYGTLRIGQLSASGWNAYAGDALTGVY